MRLPDHLFARLGREGSPVQLALFRILLGLYVFYISQSRLFDYVQFVYQGGAGHATLFPDWLDQFCFQHLPSLRLIVAACAVVFALGLAYRFSAMALAGAFLLLYNGVYFGQGTHTQWPYLWFPLVLMAFAPAADVLSADSLLFGLKRQPDLTRYRWPRELLILWLALLYCWGGLAKLLPLWQGIVWLQGGAVKRLLYDRFLYSPAYFMFGKPLFNYAEGHDWLYPLLAGATVLAELSGVVLLFTSRLNRLFVLLVAGLHGMLYLAGVGDFFLVSMLLCFWLLHPRQFSRPDAFFSRHRPHSPPAASA